MRLMKYALAAAVALTGTTALAQTVQPINATSSIAQVLTLTIVDGIVDCGTVSAAAPTQCNAAATPATVRVDANSNWSLSIEDLGGAVGDGVSLGPTLIGRLGHFVLDLALSATTGTATPLAGTPVDVTATGIRTGSAADALDYTDEYGGYEGEFIVTLSSP